MPALTPSPNGVGIRLLEAEVEGKSLPCGAVILHNRGRPLNGRDAAYNGGSGGRSGLERSAEPGQLLSNLCNGVWQAVCLHYQARLAKGGRCVHAARVSI